MFGLVEMMMMMMLPLWGEGKLLKPIASPPCSWVLPIQPLIRHPLSRSLFTVIQGTAHLYIHLSPVIRIVQDPICYTHSNFCGHYPLRYELIFTHRLQYSEWLKAQATFTHLKLFKDKYGWVDAKMGTMRIEGLASLLLFPVVFTLRWTWTLIMYEYPVLSL